MARWAPDGFERLQAAAFDLFVEQGFERTTVAEIAQRAGLTQRTFFNHFADKREVLFGLSAQFQEEVVEGLAARTDLTAPLDAVVSALQGATTRTFAGRRAAVVRRQEIVARNLELQEREFSKRAALASAIEAQLVARGVEPRTASLTAASGTLVLSTAMQDWMRSDGEQHLQDLLWSALQTLRTTIGPS